MNEDFKRRLKSMLLAATMAATMTSAKLPKVKAEDEVNNDILTKIHETLDETSTAKYKKGTFVDCENYKIYVVNEKDNLSIISKKICRYYNAEVTTKYWPVLAFLNDFPRVIQPGEVIVFLNSIENMESLLTQLNNQGWTTKYKTNNQVYSHTKKSTVKDLIREIYGKAASEDPEFVTRFLKVHDLDGDYSADTEIVSFDEMFKLTEWIPTFEELGYQKTR